MNASISALPHPAAESRTDRLLLGGLQPFSGIDYPGELAAVVFCQGCPWRCGYCQNPELLPGRGDNEIPWARVRDFLEQRRGLLDAVIFSGGEPTLQAGLAAALVEVKGMDFKTGLHSAGCYPRRLKPVLPLLDWVGLDIKALPEDYPALTGVDGSGKAAWESLQLVLAEPGLDYEVRITLDPYLLAGNRLQRLIDCLAAADVHRLVLQQCRPVEAQAQWLPLSGELDRNDWGLERFDKVLLRRGNGSEKLLSAVGRFNSQTPNQCPST